MMCATDQSRRSGGSSPNTDCRFAAPTAELSTSLDQRFPSDDAARSARYRSSDHAAPREDSESPALNGDPFDGAKRSSRNRFALPLMSLMYAKRTRLLWISDW